MGFAPIKWTCTAFFRPRQLTDRAILASRQTQEKKRSANLDGSIGGVKKEVVVVLVPSGTTGIVSAAGAVIAPLTSTSGIEPVPSAGPVCPLASIWYPFQTKASSVCPVGLRYHVKSRSALFTVQAWAKPVRLAKSLWNSFTNSPKTQLPENLPKQVLFKLKTTKLLQLSAKHFQASKTPNKTAKAQTRSKVPLPSSTSG